MVDLVDVSSGADPSDIFVDGFFEEGCDCSQVVLLEEVQEARSRVISVLKPKFSNGLISRMLLYLVGA